MSLSEEELRGLLRDSSSMPYGAAQIALLERVVQHADAGGFADLSFAARMQATPAYVYGGEPAKSFVTFSWCLAEYDRHPERYDARDEGLLRWHFKYMIGGLTRFPEVPLARTRQVLDDMERRFLAGGHSLHAVYTYRWMVAEHIGDPTADDWYARWCAAPRDENSDCVGCDPTSKVSYLIARGRDEEAVTLAEPVLAGRLTCSEQPQSILSELMGAYLRTGRAAAAADAHRRAYRRLQPNLADLQVIGSHVAFCAVTGNEPRGLEIVERHLDWLDRAPSPYAGMWFAASAALLLGRVAASAAGVTVRRAGTDVGVGELSEELSGYALSVATRFDARNGTGRVGDLVRARLAAEPVVDRLPLNAVAGRRPVTPRSDPAPARPAVPDQPDDLLAYAERLLRIHDVDGARGAWATFDERYSDPGALSPALAARRLDGRGMLCSADQRPAESQEAFEAAAAGYRAVGDEVSALAAQARALAALAVDEDRAPAALAELAEITGVLLAHPAASLERRVGALLRHAGALGRAESLDEAIGRLDEAVALVDGDESNPLLVAEVYSRRAHCLLVLERHAEAADAAAASRRWYGVVGEAPAAAFPALVHGHALGNLDDLQGAIAAFDAALRAATDPDVTLPALVGRGRANLAAGLAVEAIDDLVEAVARQVARGEEHEAAFVRYELAVAYHATGQLLDAAEAAESAVATLDRMGAQDPADRARYLLAQIYRELDEPNQAVQLLDRLAGNLDGFDNLPARAQMLEEAAQILYYIDRDALAAERFQTAAGSYGLAGLRLDQLRAQRWAALALRWAGETEQSLAALARADALVEGLAAGEPAVIWERAMLDYDATRIHIGAGQAVDALARIGGVADAFRGVDAFGEALHADLLNGELLLRLDRAVEAEPILRQVLGAAPRDSDLSRNAAWLLSEALEALDRGAEAADLRRQYGV